LSFLWPIIPRLLGDALLTRVAWIEGPIPGQNVLQTPSRLQTVLAELSHFGDVEICSKKLTFEHAVGHPIGQAGLITSAQKNDCAVVTLESRGRIKQRGYINDNR